MSSKLATPALGLAAALIATVCQAATQEIYVKQSASAQDAAQALIACKREVENMGGNFTVNAKVQEFNSDLKLQPPSVSGVVGGVVGSAIAQSIVDGEVKHAALPGCMRTRGYGKLELSDAQQATYQRLSTASAKAEWEENLRASLTPDALAEAMKPRVTPLPSAKEEPYAVGPVRLDPKRIEIATVPVSAGQTLVSAAGYYRKTARVVSRSNLSYYALFGGPRPIVVQAGALYWQTYAGPSRATAPWVDRTIWCGPAESRGKPITMCVRSTFEGYIFAETYKGPDWFPVVSPVFELSRPTMFGSLALQEVANEPGATEAFQVALKVDHVSDKGLELEAVAVRDKKEIPFWTGTASFDASGRVLLPFWNRKLIISRVGKSVSAAFDEHGDGTGW